MTNLTATQDLAAVMQAQDIFELLAWCERRREREDWWDSYERHYAEMLGEDDCHA